MSELANYSIETDHIVLLAFHDGRRLRVPVGQLAHHLAPPDLEKVRSALKLRRDFIRRHMPKVVLALAAAGGLVAALTVGGHAVANYWQRTHPVQPAPGNTGLVRSETLPHPAPTPSMQTTTVAANSAASDPPGAGVTVTTTTNTAASHTVTTHQTSTGIVQAVTNTVKNVLPVTLPIGSPTPGPQVADNKPSGTPAPVVSPTPTPAPNQGSVLGAGCDPTAPDATPACKAESGSVTPQIP